MNVADGSVLALLALADIALMVHLRRARGRRIRDERIMSSLRYAVERETNAMVLAPPMKPWALRRAS